MFKLITCKYLSGVSINEGNQDVYEFFDMNFINPIGAKKVETQSYITNTLIEE